ncbi:MAG: hypothetical protein ACREEM_15935 [Blastocatellia bacterium]
MMRILFDRGIPDALADHLPYEVTILRERGWSDLTNGELLTQAEVEFDVMITTDSNIKYQQCLEKFNIALVVLRAFKISLEKYLPMVDQIIEMIEQIEPGQVVYIYEDERLRLRDEKKGKRN